MLMAKEEPRIVVIVPPELRKRVKIKAAQEETTVSDAVRRFLAAWVSGDMEVPDEFEAAMTGT
jgi:plasmid stability protein